MTRIGIRITMATLVVEALTAFTALFGAGHADTTVPVNVTVNITQPAGLLAVPLVCPSMPLRE
ncbi:hypothetical protein AB0454_37265 [Streptomyces sp. NPDC093509]|uniref:hypothetical protein n=1 Tax=Streptomyces sp. NPDC093509 TaxID=3154982 RepID=UPI0034507876